MSETPAGDLGSTAGPTCAELERVDRLLRDPAVVVAGHALHSTSGRLAGAGRR